MCAAPRGQISGRDSNSSESSESNGFQLLLSTFLDTCPLVLGDTGGLNECFTDPHARSTHRLACPAMPAEVTDSHARPCPYRREHAAANCDGVYLTGEGPLYLTGEGPLAPPL
jgi:hypothetical protein